MVISFNVYSLEEALKIVKLKAGSRLEIITRGYMIMKRVDKDNPIVREVVRKAHPYDCLRTKKPHRRIAIIAAIGMGPGLTPSLLTMSVEK